MKKNYKINYLMSLEKFQKDTKLMWLKINSTSHYLLNKAIVHFQKMDNHSLKTIFQKNPAFNKLNPNKPMRTWLRQVLTQTP